MSSAEQIRRRRKLMLGAAAVFLLGLIAYSALMPSEEEQEFDKLKDAFTSGDRKDMNKETRQQLRKAFEKLSPETRNKLTREIMRESLYRAREETVNLSDDEKRAKIDKSIQKMRERFSKISDEDRARMRERLISEEGKQRIKEGMSFYYTEFTPKEREFMDPLVNEIMANLDAM
jgi:hypothetical protein